jgi:hypothetical protein
MRHGAPLVSEELIRSEVEERELLASAARAGEESLPIS